MSIPIDIYFFVPFYLRFVNIYTQRYKDCLLLELNTLLFLLDNSNKINDLYLPKVFYR